MESQICIAAGVSSFDAKYSQAIILHFGVVYSSKAFSLVKERNLILKGVRLYFSVEPLILFTLREDIFGRYAAYYSRVSLHN